MEFKSYKRNKAVLRYPSFKQGCIRQAILPQITLCGVKCFNFSFSSLPVVGLEGRMP